MAKYSVGKTEIGVYEKALVAATVDTVEFAANLSYVEVIKEDEGAAIYFTVDGGEPSVAGQNCWQMPGGGMFFWVDLPEGVDSEALLVKAVARGVAFVPGAPFFAGAPRANTLRLSFVTVGADLIERGIAALADALRDLREEAVVGAPAKTANPRAELAR